MVLALLVILMVKHGSYHCGQSVGSTYVFQEKNLFFKNIFFQNVYVKTQRVKNVNVLRKTCYAKKTL